MSECDREASIMEDRSPLGAVASRQKVVNIDLRNYCTLGI